MLNAKTRKELKAALLTTARSKVSEEAIEKAALRLIKGESRASIAESLGVSTQTLSNRLKVAAEVGEAVKIKPGSKAGGQVGGKSRKNSAVKKRLKPRAPSSKSEATESA